MIGEATTPLLRPTAMLKQLLLPWLAALALPLSAVRAAEAPVATGLSEPLPLTGRAEPSGVAAAPAQLGPRPFFLVGDLSEGPLKQQLQACAQRGVYTRREFSIGHRGAALQFPEHTKESYEAAARMGAGIVECDVTFTKDRQLVCRHAQNDLHTTTNILATPLAASCIRPFTPARLDAAGRLQTPASAECRTSEITLAEFKTLRGKMDASNPRALTVAEYLGGTASWRTDLYSGPSSGTVLTHRESIELFKQLGVKMAPELKAPSVAMPFDGLTQAAYAQQMIDEYRQAGVPPQHVWPQSFHLPDVLYWVKNTDYGRQAVYLDDARSVADLPGGEELASYKAQGVQIVAPPIFALLRVEAGGRLRPSEYAVNARAAGLGIIAWTLERSGRLADSDRDFYYQGLRDAVRREGDTLQVLDALARQVGVLGVFSDWPATTTFYANCLDLR